MDSIVKISFEFKHIIIILIILIMFIIAYNNIEKLTFSDESVLNLEKVYGNIDKKLYFNNLVIDDIDADNFKGIIVMWSGTIDKIPSGWYLCDGTNETPDLRSRFILGASSDKPASTTGGAEKVVLNSSDVSSHTHNYNWDKIGCSGAFCGKEFNSYASMIFNTQTVPENKSVKIGTNKYGTPIYKNYYEDANYHKSLTNPQNNFLTKTGSKITSVPFNSAGHENMPPYFALAYIMRK